MASPRKPVLLDTCVLIDLLHGREGTAATVRGLIVQGFELTVSPINIAEVYAGMRRGEEDATEELLAALACPALTPEMARRAGNLVAERRRAGRTHTLDDMMIAATAIERGCTLMTANRKDFEIAELEIYEP